MGRWDALKPADKPTEAAEPSSSSSSSSTIFRGQSAKSRQSKQKPSGFTPINNRWKPQFSSSTSSRWNSRDRSDAGTKDSNAFNSESLTRRLTYELESWRKNKKDAEMNRIQTLLEEIVAPSGVAHESVSPILLANLLEIDNDEIQRHALQLINGMGKHCMTGLERKEAVVCVDKLVDFVAVTKEHLYLSTECLCRLVSSQTKVLPAENIAHRVVGPIFIPTLQARIKNESLKLLVCQTVDNLLMQSPFASAMLAPLVQDVSKEGMEQTVVNPIRQSLIQSLQAILFSKVTTTVLQSSACTSLACTIDALRKTRNDETSIMPVDLDVVSLERFITTHLESSSPLRRSSFLLLRSLLQTFPKPMTKVGSRLLFPTPSILRSDQQRLVGKCPRCSCHFLGVCPFLYSVHNAIDTELSALALDCIVNLMSALPWSIWLKQQPAGRAVTGFYRRVVDSLSTIIEITRCAILKWRKTKWEDALRRLCTKLFVELPWEDVTVVKTGLELWSTLVTILLDPDVSTTSKADAASALTSSMGGRVTPQGDLPPMAIPAQRYLSSDKGIQFVKRLLAGIQPHKDAVFSQVARELLSSMLRTRPETILCFWEDFRGLLEEAANGDTMMKGVGLDLLESMLLGRCDFPSDKLSPLENTYSITNLSFVLLEKTRDDTNARNRTRSMNSYAALLQRDWEHLRFDRDYFDAHIHGMLFRCNDSKADVRRASCKAVGEFCSKFLSKGILLDDSENWDVAAVADRTRLSMVRVIKGDKNAAARSMATFALGNLALAMSDHDALELVSFESVAETVHAICDLLEGSNDKLVGNAIRSCGHWGSILARRIHDSQSASCNTQNLVLLIQKLSEKVCRTLALATPEQQAQMSWKERSAAKKHGWGACHALGRILGCIFEWQEGSHLQYAALRALSYLIRCLQYDTVPSQKVIIAAMAALRSVKPLHLVNVAGKSGLVGQAMVSCCGVLFEARGFNNPKLAEEASRLLVHLLSCASIADVVIVLKHEETSKVMLESLYGWMVEQGLEGRAFEIFAVGMQRAGLIHNVFLEQRFASRAMMQYKKEQSISLNIDGLDDGADEL